QAWTKNRASVQTAESSDSWINQNDVSRRIGNCSHGAAAAKIRGKRLDRWIVHNGITGKVIHAVAHPGHLSDIARDGGQRHRTGSTEVVKRVAVHAEAQRGAGLRREDKSGLPVLHKPRQPAVGSAQE